MDNMQDYLPVLDESDGEMRELTEETANEMDTEDDHEVIGTNLQFQTVDADGKEVILRYTVSSDGKKICSECPKRYSTLGLLGRHCREKHLMEESYTCGLCGKSGFSGRDAVRRHFKMYCPKRFNNPECKPWDSHESCRTVKRSPSKRLSTKARGKLRVQRFEDRAAKTKIRSFAVESEVARRRPYTEYEWEESQGVEEARARFQRIKPTVFENYNFLERLEAPLQKINRSKEETAAVNESIEDVITEDFVGVSSDGVMLVTYLADGLRQLWPTGKGDDLLRETMDAILRLEKVYSPPPPGEQDIRHQDFADLVKRFKVVGRYHFGVWTARGQGKAEEVFKGAILSKDTRATDEIKAHVLRYHQEIAPLIQSIAMIVEAVDPELSHRYRANYDHFFDNKDEFQPFRVSNRAAFLAHALLRNLCAEPHRDTSDVRDGLVAMCCFGDFKGGGELVLPDLKSKIEYKAGSVVIFRSALLEHSIRAIKQGQRSSLVFFTHSNVSDAFEHSHDM